MCEPHSKHCKLSKQHWNSSNLRELLFKVLSYINLSLFPVIVVFTPATLLRDSFAKPHLVLLSILFASTLATLLFVVDESKQEKKCKNESIPQVNKLVNIRNNLSYTGKIVLADTFFKKLLGFMFKRPKGVIIFVFPCEAKFSLSVHGFFMLDAIDVIFLNSRGEVVDCTVLKPFTIYVPKKPAKYVIEGEKGLIKMLGVKKGDKIVFR